MSSVHVLGHDWTVSMPSSRCGEVGGLLRVSGESCVGCAGCLVARGVAGGEAWTEVEDADVTVAENVAEVVSVRFGGCGRGDGWSFWFERSWCEEFGVWVQLRGRFEWIHFFLMRGIGFLIVGC